MKRLALSIIILLVIQTTAMSQGKTVSFEWSLLNKIPDSIGFAGSFVGVANDVLIVAGGSNFPDGGAPWLGSKKVWHNKIFILKSPSSNWEEAGLLPHSLGYGTSVSTSKGLVIIGGSNETGHSADVILLKYKKDKIQIETLPSLPFPLANSCGALVGQTIYVAGGILSSASKETEKVFLSLDLSKLQKGWTNLSTWSGESRMLAVAASSKKNFYLFSGTKLEKGHRHYLKDAYSYNDKTGWKKLKDLPSAVVAAPSPAYTFNDGIFLFGGDDGRLADSNLKELHPGFSSKILCYKEVDDEWTVAGEILTDKHVDSVKKPNESIWAPVTTTLALWHNRIILAGGEVRPATRTPNVLSAIIKH